jgi:putative serine protease PepD
VPALALAAALAALVLSIVALTTGDGGQQTTAALPAAAGGRPASTQAGRVYDSASPGVVSVRVGNGSGTGFVVRGDGTIVTNAHVVGDAKSAQVSFGDSRRMVTAEVLGRDESSDVAVLRVDPGSAPALHPLVLADSDAVHVGDSVVAIGHPFGLDRTATAGIVSGLGRQIQAPDGFQIDHVIQTDAPINPGNSGGPLLDTRGRVIGITTQIATGGAGNGNIGIGFAVPANRVREVVPALAGGQQIVRPYLGVTSAQAPRGAEVVTAASGGPAAKAGLKKGDVIVRVDGHTVKQPDDVAGAIEQHKAGDVVQVTVLRNGARVSYSVELGKRPPHAP